MESTDFLRDLADRLHMTDAEADRLGEIADELEGLDSLVNDYMAVDRNRMHWHDE